MKYNYKYSADITNYLSNIAVVFFVLQQIGISFHLSFGSLGLLIIAYLVKDHLSLSSFKLPLFLCLLVLLSFVWVLIKYDYDQNILNIFPISISIFFLFSMLRNDGFICPPSNLVLIACIVLVCVIGGFQLFFDRSFQIPASFFAMSENLAVTDNQQINDFYRYTLRTNSIYSEPSYAGMVLCGLYVLLFYSDSKIKLPVMFLILLSQIMFGSGLGLVGMSVILALTFKELSLRWQVYYAIVAVIGVMLAIFIFNDFLNEYDIAIFNRATSTMSEGDDSLSVRLINPFVLIYENFVNFDWLGVPSDFYDHFYYTALYNDLGSFPGHNGILGLMIRFGMLGILIIYIVFKQLRNSLELALVLIIGSQNGSFLTYEKVFSILFILLALRGARYAYYARLQENIV